MRDYWLTQYLLAAVGWGYLLLVLVALVLALWLPKSRKVKVVAGAVVLALASVLPIQGYQQYLQQQEAQKARQERYAKAKALFDERCKTAGEKIYRTVDEVDGILLENTRGELALANYADRNWGSAGFPSESVGNQYIMEFLFYNLPAQGDRAPALSPESGGFPGYHWVDVPAGSKVRRYTLKRAENFVSVGASDPVDRYGNVTEITSSSALYSVVYENLVDSEGRAYWVAGGRVTIRNRISGEVLGELVRYAFEPGLGATAGGRSPWTFATVCHQSGTGGRGAIRSFTERVLKPRRR